MMRQSTPAPAIEARIEAKHCLLCRGNWITVLFALMAMLTFLCVSCFFANCLAKAAVFSTLFGTVSNDSAEYYSLLTGLGAALFFLLSPLTVGYTALCNDLRFSAEAPSFVPISELFCPYENLPALIRAWKFCLVQMGIHILFPLTALFAFSLRLLLEPLAGDLATPLAIAVGIPLSIAALVFQFSAMYMDFLFVSQPELSIYDCFRKSVYAVRNAPSLCFAYVADTLFYSFAGLFTGGIFFLYAVPYLTYYRLTLAAVATDGI